MKIDLILSHLEKVRQTGRDSWVACCPAHDDKSPSMTLRELDDGRILLHCFAGCSVDEIVGAVGMTLSDLFPDKPIEHAKPLRRQFPAADVLECIRMDSLYVAVCASILSRGEALDEGVKSHLLEVNDRIMEARRLANGER